ncbi:endo-1,4-beta-xylanase [Nodosilinea sp. LEGE 07298]|uniref:endo-1,4-beta-xylanase n=1 Tax=Nodosilinea sp. LEGE 07298 TaxID=2777970 RepID=UPI0018825CCD|nr:endo-1,4-beta-xylanase [Nodosilinea sp. LEGE 07298]MBE9107844.1 endo-1,4-beta-xylanase [Nodosilinea sp. LEGE 07298]
MLRPKVIFLAVLAGVVLWSGRGIAITPHSLLAQGPTPQAHHCALARWLRLEREPTLADLARRQDLYVGTAVNLKALGRDRRYRRRLAQEFNLVTAENDMKLERLQPRPHEFDFSQADRLMAFAADHHMAVRGHTLVWHRALPDWLEQRDWSRDELMALLENHIKTVVGRYRGQIVAWDVVNEAIADDGTLRDTLWLRGIGPDYIELAFRWAYEADPDALLMYNDYGGEGLNAKSDAIYNLVKSLRDKAVPIHGVGLQMHVQANSAPSPQEVAANMARLADLGLQAHITEMDVRIEQPSSPGDADQQADVYQAMLQTCLQAENCNTFVTWGFSDRYSWVPGYFDGWGEALIFDRDYRAKPAYHSLLDALANHPTSN